VSTLEHGTGPRDARHCRTVPEHLIEPDHRFIRRRTRPMLGFKRFSTAWRSLRGIEMMHALRKGRQRATWSVRRS